MPGSLGRKGQRISRGASPLTALFALAGLTSWLTEMSPSYALPEITQTPPCASELRVLRKDGALKESAVRMAVAAKEPPQEVCRLFGELLEAEMKLINYMERNAGWCGIPDGELKQFKAEHDIRAAVVQRTCAAARI